MKVVETHPTIEAALQSVAKVENIGEIVEIHDEECDETKGCTCEPVYMQIVPAVKS